MIDNSNIDHIKKLVENIDCVLSEDDLPDEFRSNFEDIKFYYEKEIVKFKNKNIGNLFEVELI